MISHAYTYQSALKDALKVNWQVEDLIGGNKRLDFTKPFLPEALAGVEDIPCLSQQEKLKLNQIRGNSYLHLFVVVEEFIIPTVLEHIQRMGFDDMHAIHALLRFAEDEGKHIRLFQRFAEEFELGFGTHCECIGPTQAIADQILKYHPLSVLFFTLHIEWTTQSHYLETIRDNQAENLDPQFCSLLKHHWMEEAQHTKLDTLLIEELSNYLPVAEISVAFDDYLAIATLFDRVLAQQVQLDLEALTRAIDRPLSEAEKLEIQGFQEQSYRWTFLCSGMSHPNLLKVLDELDPVGKERVIAMAKVLS